MRPVDVPPWPTQEPTYRLARPALIARACERATARPSGNWFVFAASRDITADRPMGVRVGGVELVAWRDQRGVLVVGPGACPHLGAPMALAKVDRGALVCRWHGLRVDAAGCGGWSPRPSHDDGVLAWVRLDEVGGEPPSARPFVPDRPSGDRRLDAVIQMVGRCETRDIVANRLDPWHGAWFHPYSFAHLRVVSVPGEHGVADDEDRLLVDVTFRISRRLGVPVRAEFVCPEPRTVVMRIVRGEGVGSVVETHATPLGIDRDGRPRTAVIEAAVVSSTRPGFGYAARIAPLVRPLMRMAAARLWRDDLAYAERRYALRTGRV